MFKFRRILILPEFMLRKISPVPLLLLLACWYSLTACEFELSEINKVTVDPEPKARLNLNELAETDTLIIVDLTTLYYDLSVTSGSFNELVVYLNEVEVHRSRDSKGDFHLYYTDLPTGIYDMRYEIYTSTGTNSLADKAGGERLLFKKNLKIIFDNDRLTKPEGLSVQKNEEGQLVVKWNRNKRYIFRNYVLRRWFRDRDWPRYYGDYQAYEEFKMESARDTLFTDSTYFGNEHFYTLSYETIGGDQSPYAETEYYEPGPYVVSFATIEGNKLRLNWNKSLYPNLFRSYSLSLWKNDQVIIQTTIHSDTSFVLDKPFDFGGHFKVMLTTIPYFATEEEVAEGKYSSATDVFFGEKARPYQQVLYDQDGNSYIVADYWLYKLNDQLEATDSLYSQSFSGANMELSRDGNYLHVHYGTEIQFINTDGLEIEKQLDINSLAGNSDWRGIINFVPLSNNDFYIRYNDYLSFRRFIPRFAYYNASDDSLYQINTGVFMVDNIMGGTEDGRLTGHYNGRTVGLVMEKDSILEIREITPDTKKILPLTASPDKFLLVDNVALTAETWRFSDFSKESEIALPAGTLYALLNQDNSSLTALTSEENGNYLRQLDFYSGEEILVIDLWEYDNGSWPSTNVLLNGWIYSSSGYKMNVQNLLP